MSGGELSKSELLAELRRVSERLDRTPSMRDMTEHGDFSPSTYQSRFGSWNEAVTEAGLSPNSRDDPVYADDELLAELRDVAAALDRAPRKSDVRERGSISPTTYVDRFGTWRDALSHAGLTPDHRGTKISERELLDGLEALAAALGRPPTSTEMDEAGAFSSATYFRRFDSWEDALEAADLSPPDDSNTSKLSEQALIDEISRMADVLNRPPTTTEMDELGEYSASTYRRRFGSWENALREAGVEQTRPRQGTAPRVSEQELLDELRNLAAELDRPPTAEEMWKRGSHGPATYLDRYETWNAALEAAGLETRRWRKAGISERELIRANRALARMLGRCPQRQEMEERGPISGMTYYNRFGSWQAALDAAGLTDASADDEAIVRGHCTVCCKPLAEPVSALSASGRLYCGQNCEEIFEKDAMRFEEDVVNRKTSDDQVLGRIAALLHEAETYVPAVLLYLRHGIAMRRAGFSSATTETCQITQFDGTVEVTPTTEPHRFQVDEEVLTEIEDRIAQIVDQAEPVRSLASSTNSHEDDGDAQPRL